MEVAGIQLADWPENCVARGVLSESSPELIRLIAFRYDLNSAQRYIDLLREGQFQEGQQGAIKEALFEAALLRTIKCFEGSTGARQKPLKAKKVLSFDQRAHLKEFVGFRNKVLAHDDDLYPMATIVAAFDASAKARRVYTLKGRAEMHSMVEFVDRLEAIVASALDWISQAQENEADLLIERLNSLSEEERNAALNLPDFTLAYKSEDGLPRWHPDYKEPTPTSVFD